MCLKHKLANNIEDIG